MFYKKGLSPLIATMLLIAFAVSLGVVIITVLNSLITPDVCSNVMLVGSQHYSPVCYIDKGNVKVYDFHLVYNNTKGNGNEKIINLTFNFFGKTSSMTKTYPPSLDSLRMPQPVSPGAQMNLLNIPYDTSNYGALQSSDSIEVIPVVKDDTSQQSYVCSLQKYVIDVNQIPKCSSSN